MQLTLQSKKLTQKKKKLKVLTVRMKNEIIPNSGTKMLWVSKFKDLKAIKLKPKGPKICFFFSHYYSRGKQGKGHDGDEDYILLRSKVCKDIPL